MRAPLALSAAVLLLLFAFVEAAMADQTVHLTVRVTDGEGKNLPAAHVIVYQERIRGSTLYVRPPDYQDDTNANGIVGFEIQVKAGEKLNLSFEVAKEDFQTTKEDVDLGTDFPSRILRKFILESRPRVETAETTTIEVHVIRKDGTPVESANVVVLSIGGFTPKRFSGMTDANGVAVIVTPLNNEFEIKASKGLFGEVKRGLVSKDYPKVTVPQVLTLERPAGAAVTISVTDQDPPHKPIGDATVVLNGPGYHSETTDGSGNATFFVPETGTFAVGISQQYYEPLTGGALQLVPKEETKSASFFLVPKAKKEEEAKDTIEVTVLKKDPTEDKSKPSPLAGALVKIGRSGVPTDGSGHATLKGSYDIKQEVTVEATGYKSKTLTVSISKLMRYSGGTGTATFILDPDLSENSPMRLIVEVRGPSGPLKGAGVDFSLADGRYLSGRPTNASGEADFRNIDSPDVSIADLRKGLVVKVKSDGYKEVTSSVSADLLKPSLEARRFTVQLEKDWSALRDAIAALESRVAALDAGPSKQQDSEWIDKALVARKRAEELLKEIETAKEGFGIEIGPGGRATTRCRKAIKLKEDIQLCEAEANQKAQELKQLLDLASISAPVCSTLEGADVIRSSYRSAIKLLAEIGARNKKAVKDRDELLPLATESVALKQLLGEVQAKITAIDEASKTAEETAKTAAEQYGQFNDLVKNFAATQIALKAELAGLRVKYEVDTVGIPSDLLTRVHALENKLNPGNSVIAGIPKSKNVPQSVTGASSAIAGIQAQAEKLMAQYRSAVCTIDTMDEMVDGIDTTLTNATFEVGLAADLPKLADACTAKVATAAKAPSDQVTVPDVASLDDPGAAQAAAAPAMVGVIVATNETPPNGSTKLIARQNPLPYTKAKRGDPLQIFIYQALAEAKPSPSPSSSPSAENDMVTVPDVSGFSDPKAMLAAAGPDMKGMIQATNKTPPKGSTKLFCNQYPLAYTKAPRGAPLLIFVYQALAEATSSPSPSAESDLVIVPDVSGFNDPKAMLAAVGPDMKGMIQATDKTPPKGSTKLFSHQYPPAYTKAPRGAPLLIFVYQSLAEPEPASPSSRPTPDGALAEATPMLHPGTKVGSGGDIADTTSTGTLWKDESSTKKSPTKKKQPTPIPKKKKKKSTGGEITGTTGMTNMKLRNSWHLVFLVLVLPGSLNALEITGTVREATGDTAMVACDGDVVPSVGDKVTIFFKPAGADYEVSVGNGKVTDVSATSIKIKIESATGTVNKGQLARFSTDSPQKKPTASIIGNWVGTAPDGSKHSLNFKDGQTIVFKLAESASSTKAIHAKYRLDYTSKPPHIEIFDSDSPDRFPKGETVIGLFEFQDDSHLKVDFSGKAQENRDKGFTEYAIIFSRASESEDSTSSSSPLPSESPLAMNNSPPPSAPVNSATEAASSPAPSPDDQLVSEGNELYDRNDIEAAVAAFTKAIELNPKNAKAYFGRGFCYRRKSKTDAAISDWKKAMALDPSYASGLEGVMADLKGEDKPKKEPRRKR